MRVYRGAEVASDHRLLISDIKLKLKHTRRNLPSRMRYRSGSSEGQGLRREVKDLSWQ